MTTECQYRYPQRPGLGTYAGELCLKGPSGFEHNPRDHRTCDSINDGSNCMYHEYQPEPVLTIDLTPTEEGFASTACLFVQSVISDVKVARTDADKNLLEEVVKIVFMLGQKGREDQVRRIIRAIR